MYYGVAGSYSNNQVHHISLHKRITHNSRNNASNDNNDNNSDNNKSNHRGDKDRNNDNTKVEWVINMSNTPLMEAKRLLLARGPNFMVVPKQPPEREYVVALEEVC